MKTVGWLCFALESPVFRYMMRRRRTAHFQFRRDAGTETVLAGLVIGCGCCGESDVVIARAWMCKHGRSGVRSC